MSQSLKQKERVLEHLKTFAGITPLEALSQLGVMRLAAVIHKLKADGVEIETRRVKVQNRWREECNVARYHLAGKAPPLEPDEPEVAAVSMEAMLESKPQMELFHA